jgi:hypothetical protein
MPRDIFGLTLLFCEAPIVASVKISFSLFNPAYIASRVSVIDVVQAQFLAVHATYLPHP